MPEIQSGSWGTPPDPFYTHAASGKVVTGLAAVPVARNSVGYFIHYVSADVKHSSCVSSNGHPFFLLTGLWVG